ncbi:hypothetical protein OG530_40385 [Streptomyces decoyicus]|uniref:hypothetical protein n=1 Tax=Streptomyces decoyicus TaxID=249567 RepID=UPI002E19F2C4
MTRAAVYPAQVPEHLEQLREDLPARRDTDRHASLTKEAAGQRRTEAEQTKEAGGLRDEATLRGRLTPGQAAEETTEPAASKRADVVRPARLSSNQLACYPRCLQFLHAVSASALGARTVEPPVVRRGRVQCPVTRSGTAREHAS